MIFLQGAGPGTYGPFFLDAQHSNILITGTSAVGGSGLAVRLSTQDEFGSDLFSISATWFGAGAFSGGGISNICAGNYTVVVSANMSGVNITIHQFPG